MSGDDALADTRSIRLNIDLVVVAAIDGPGTIRQLTVGRPCLIENGQVRATFALRAIEDLRNLTDVQPYDRLLQEFPDWLRAARANGIVH